MTSFALLFWFRVIAQKVLNSQDFFNSKRTLVAIFSKTCALTSRKSVVVQDMNIPKSIQKYKFLWSHSSAFFFFRIIASKMLTFKIHLLLTKPLVITFSETRPFTFRNYEIKKRAERANIIKKQNLLWWHYFVLL